MKLHSIVDIITNSSSSTFIVGFKELPQTIGQTLDVLFPNGPHDITVYDIYTISASDVASRVFNDIQDAKVVTTKEEMLETVRSGWFEGYPERDYDEYTESDRIDDEFRKLYPGKSIFNDPEWNQKRFDALRVEWAEQDVKVQAAAEAYVEKIWDMFKDHTILVFSYADDEGEGALEHGDIFVALPHVTISCH